MKRSKVLIGVLTACMLACGAATAQTATSAGLGSAWPNAQDVSANPQYHVYRWQQGGVAYTQVNDLSGNVRFAVGVVGKVVFVLPIGNPQEVSIAAQPASASDASATSAPTTVYSDSQTTVQQTASTFVVSAVQTKCPDPTECTAVATN